MPQQTQLTNFLAANPRDNPLVGADEGYQNKIFSDVANHILSKSEQSNSKQPISAADTNTNLPKKMLPGESVGAEQIPEGFSDATIALEIAKKEKSIETLKLWVNNTLSEWLHLDPSVNSYEVRSKPISSLINKIRRKSNEPITSTKSLWNIIDDIVAARLLVYTPLQILSTHQQIVEHKRFELKKITFHYNQKFSSSVIDRVIELAKAEESTGKFEIFIKESESGYTAVHYIIEPQPYDELYFQDKSIILNRFELLLPTRGFSVHATPFQTTSL